MIRTVAKQRLASLRENGAAMANYASTRPTQLYAPT
jgi:hypothetical protein